MIDQRSKFPNDAHDVVMLIRTTIELFICVISVLLSQYIPWLQNFPQLSGLRIGVSVSLFCSLIFLSLTIRQRLLNKPISTITYFESIADTILIIWLIFIFGGMKGPFFFFFLFNLLEAAFTFKLSMVLVVAGMGIISMAGEYIIGIYSKNIVMTPEVGFLLFFKFISIGLIGYYSYTFMKSILREKKSAENLQTAFAELKQINAKLETANKRISYLLNVRDAFVSIAVRELQMPLNAIKNYIWMFRKGKDFTNFDAKQKQNLNKIEKDTNKLFEALVAFAEKLPPEKQNNEAKSQTTEG